MAEQFKLVLRIGDDPTGYGAVDLLNPATDGISLQENGYIPGVSSDEEPDIAESIALVLRGTTHDALATALQKIDEKIAQAARYIGINRGTEAEQYSVWLLVQTSAETGSRKALIKSLRRVNTGEISQYGLDSADGYYRRTVTLQLTRGPWERHTYSTVSGSGVSTVASYTNTTVTVVGDMFARIGYARMLGDGSGSGPLHKYWMGFRTARFGTLANFQPYWSLRKSAAFDTDTTGGTTNSDATAKDGYKTITTFATVPTLLRRATIKCTNVTSNEDDQRGEYKVLLRAKVTSTAVVRVRMADGLYSSPALSARLRVKITSTDWQFYEVGNITIPTPGRFGDFANMTNNYSIGIDAELVSGSGNLEMDCLCMIPTAEGFVYAEGGAVVNPQDVLYARQLPEGGAASLSFVSLVPVGIGTPVVSKGVPTGALYIVFCAQRSASSVLADTCDISVRYYSRWSDMRGSE